MSVPSPVVSLTVFPYLSVYAVAYCLPGSASFYRFRLGQVSIHIVIYIALLICQASRCVFYFHFRLAALLVILIVIVVSVSVYYFAYSSYSIILIGRLCLIRFTVEHSCYLSQTVIYILCFVSSSVFGLRSILRIFCPADEAFGYSTVTVVPSGFLVDICLPKLSYSAYVTFPFPSVVLTALPQLIIRITGGYPCDRFRQWQRLIQIRYILLRILRSGLIASDRTWVG